MVFTFSTCEKLIISLSQWYRLFKDIIAKHKSNIMLIPFLEITNLSILLLLERGEIIEWDNFAIHFYI